MRRKALKSLFAATVALYGLVPAMAQAQFFKAPIKIIVPQAPGGGTDLVARVVAPGLSKELGQPVVIENRPGASGKIGAQFVQRAAPDGTTILCTVDHSMLIVPVTEPNVRYDAVNDFVALGQGARTYWALTLPASSPHKDFKEYVAALKRDALLRSYGVPLTGGAPGVVGDVIGQYAGVEMVQIPFSGSAPVLQNIMAGQVPAGITGMAEAVSAYRSGKAKVIAVTGKERTPILPEVTTFHELGVSGLDFYTFVGFFAPKGLPQQAAQEFNAALRKTLADPAVQEKITGTGMQPAITTLEEANREVGTMARFWKETFTKR